jgi:hypothetical protein
MKRYRLLTREELEAVEPDVIQFLAESGVTASDWSQWKAENDPRVEEMLLAFSEGFWDRATAKVEFLERRTADETWVFAFDETHADLIRCAMDPDTQEVSWFRGKKSFEPEARGREVFLLLEQGAEPIEKARWLAVQSAMNGASVN